MKTLEDLLDTVTISGADNGYIVQYREFGKEVVMVFNYDSINSLCSVKSMQGVVSLLVRHFMREHGMAEVRLRIEEEKGRSEVI